MYSNLLRRTAENLAKHLNADLTEDLAKENRFVAEDCGVRHYRGEDGSCYWTLCCDSDGTVWASTATRMYVVPDTLVAKG